MSGLPVSHDQLLKDGSGYALGAQADLGRPVRLLHQVLSLRERIAKGEGLLKELKAQLLELEQEQMPAAMDEAGVTKMVADGYELVVDPVITGSIPDVRAVEACTWLRANGHAQLVQHTFVINTKRKEDSAAVKLRKQLTKAGFEFVEKENVHHMSLKAWAREQIQRGVALPYDLLGLWVGRRATVKPVKEK